MRSDRHPDTEARLLVPRMSLGGLVRAHLWRDTTRAGRLSDSQRTSWFPATPLCGLSWTLEGGGWQIDDMGGLHPVASQCMISGPRTRPVQYRSADGIRCFMTGFAPDAFHRLTGLDIAALTDSIMPIESLLDSDWQDLGRRMLRAPDAETCRHLLEAFLQPRWHEHVARHGPAGPRYTDWMQNLALRAVAAGNGASLRQVERRIKQWTGQSMRLLRRIGRSEEAFFQARTNAMNGDVVWSILAQDAGYSDQAHLCRETRRVTGFSPEELRRRIERDEAFWSYRIWV